MPIMRGEKGQRGATGARGPRGERGEPGGRGPAGPTPTRNQILEAVRQEFDVIRTHFQVQIERTAQMQKQLDTIQNLVTQALEKG